MVASETNRGSLGRQIQRSQRSSREEEGLPFGPPPAPRRRARRCEQSPELHRNAGRIAREASEGASNNRFLSSESRSRPRHTYQQLPSAGNSRALFRPGTSRRLVSAEQGRQREAQLLSKRDCPRQIELIFQEHGADRAIRARRRTSRRLGPTRVPAFSSNPRRRPAERGASSEQG